VNLRADAITPNDTVLTLRQRFAAPHARVDKLQPAQSTIEPQTLIVTTAAAQTTEDVDDDDGNEDFSQGLERSKSVYAPWKLQTHQIIKMFNRLVCDDVIKQAKVHSKLASIVPWKPKQYTH
jgi:hypothetical protein